MLIIDGLNLQDDAFMFVLKGLFNTEKGMFESDLFSDGSVIGHEKIKAKKLLLNGSICKNIQENIDKLNRVMYKKGPKKMEFSILGKEYMMMVNVESGAMNDSLMSFNLISPDSYRYSRYPEILHINETKGTGVRFPLRFPLRFEGGQGFERYVNNIGTEVSYPIITIKGPCRDFAITNITTNEKLEFIGLELLEGDTLVIDNRPKTRGIYLNGVNRPDLRNGYWISCDIGQNYFTFSRVSNSLDTLCTIELQSRWI